MNAEPKIVKQVTPARRMPGHSHESPTLFLPSAFIGVYRRIQAFLAD
jgi:hypothetical protein